MNNSIYGIDATNPSSRDDKAEFVKLLSIKLHNTTGRCVTPGFWKPQLEECISLEMDFLKKITNSLTGLHSEKQKQEKTSKAKIRLQVVLAGRRPKAIMKDIHLANCVGYDGFNMTFITNTHKLKSTSCPLA
jgi:translation initiation factor 3 subunit J